MKTRVRCPFHAEKTPSLVRRKNDFYCYGSCAKSYTLEEVAARGISAEYEEEYEEPESLVGKFQYIKSLPRREIRGLRFPADERGYFVSWPGDAYYKYRLYNPGQGSKYLGPKGHKPPLFWARRSGAETLSIVEGEISALSVAKAMEEWDVCSPGSASQFNSLNMAKYLTDFAKYNKIIVILDNDAAGIKGLIEAKAFFLYKIPFISYLLIKPDANEVLVEKGKEALRAQLLGADYK